MWKYNVKNKHICTYLKSFLKVPTIALYIRTYYKVKAITLKSEAETDSHKMIVFHQSNSEARQEKEDYRGLSNKSYLYS